MVASAHAKLLPHVLDLLQPHLDSASTEQALHDTPNSLLRASRLRFILRAVLHSQDNHMEWRERFAFVEHSPFAPVVDAEHQHGLDPNPQSHEPG